ncbi:TELO2-interacting protein 1 homolog [Adelges cooleyi]|uniref:TELO2-interacting protein 1 homolog n=1 Tax=Adelges cooleyi TaxID=133065 RepID=UPI00217F5909|nr:TELO2-interacting protein 1 homolog [Adelges cooleyi]
MTVDKENFKKAFETLKPACDAFITEPNAKNSKRLAELLSTIPTDSLEPLQRYVLIPIEVHMKTDKSDNTLNVLNVLTTLLQKTSIDVWPTFNVIYTLLVSKLSNKNNPEQVVDVSEDIKLAVTVCMNLLVGKSNVSVLSRLYREADCKNVGYFIFVCTKMIKYEKMNALRVEAIKCIQILTSVWTKINENGIRQKIIGDLTKFVPGVLSVCSIIANAPDTQHHSSTVAALNLWSSITSLLICDDHVVIEDGNPYNKHLKTQVSKSLSDEEKQLNGWIKENNKQFKVVLSYMIKTREHQHWRVRLQLVTSCNLLLNKCSRSMNSSVTDLIETLLVLSDDEQPQVEKLANESIVNLIKIFDQRNEKTLIELLEESFYVLLSRIPRSIRMSNLAKQKTDLSLLSGYIKLFGPSHLPRVLNSYAHLDRMITVLTQVLELEYKTISLLKDTTIRDLNNLQTSSGELSLNVPWKQWVHFIDTSAIVKIENICKLIGSYGDRNFIVRYLMDLFETKTQCRKEITLLLNLTLSENNDDVCHYDLVSDVIQLYLDNKVWYLATSADDESTQNIAETQKNVLQICLMTEGLGHLVSSLDLAKQRVCLVHCLYPILERVGSELNSISLAGQTAISLISKSGGYKDPVDLVIKNSDYLSHHFTTKLWLLRDHPEVLNALGVVMNINNNDNLLHSFHAIVTDVLVQSCDAHRTDNLHSFLKVFYIFIVCVRNWLENSKPKIEFNYKKSKSSEGSIVENLLEYHRMSTIDLTRNDECWQNEPSSGQGIGSDNEETEKPLPPYIEMVVSIMKRVLHFLPLQHHFLPLQILNEGLKVISSYENQLLPMVHKIWSPLCTKFSVKSDDLIFREAFNLLNTMAIFAKDFIKSRSLKLVIPCIMDRLKSSSHESKNIPKGSVYFTSHKYKLQLTILSNSADLVLNLNLTEKDMYDMSNAVACYLDKNQPHSLQDKSKEFYLKLHAKNSDFTWIYLQSLYVDEHEYKSKNERLPTIKVFSTSKFQKTDTLKNVTEIINLLET